MRNALRASLVTMLTAISLVLTSKNALADDCEYSSDGFKFCCEYRNLTNPEKNILISFITNAYSKSASFNTHSYTDFSFPVFRMQYLAKTHEYMGSTDYCGLLSDKTTMNGVEINPKVAFAVHLNMIRGEVAGVYLADIISINKDGMDMLNHNYGENCLNEIRTML